MLRIGFQIQMGPILGDLQGPQDIHVGGNVVLLRLPFRWYRSFRRSYHQGFRLRHIHDYLAPNASGWYRYHYSFGFHLRDKQNQAPLARHCVSCTCWQRLHVHKRLTKSSLNSVVCIFPIAGGIALTQVPSTKTGGLMASYYVAYLFSALRK